MGNVADSKPQLYSGDMLGRPYVYGGGYMATYKQNDPSADSMQYGGTKLQFGVKLIQDVEPGPRLGDLYVADPNGKRLYFTHDNKPYSNAAQIIRHGQGFGNGPAVMITGNPLQPQYHMFYSKSADLHGPTNEWTPIAINNKADILKAMAQGPHGTGGKYANMYGDASIDPFDAAEGRNTWTDINQVQHTIVNIIGQIALPIAEAALDSFVPGASLFLNATGINKSLQSGINSLLAPPPPDKASPFDPSISNMITDPRLSGYLKQVTDQSQQFITKYGPSDYTQIDQMAQDTPQQQLLKAEALAKANQTLYTTGQVQKMQDMVAKLKTILPSGTGSDIFSNIETGLGIASTNQQKLNVLSHFGSQIQKQLLPLISKTPGTTASSGDSVHTVPADLNPSTASAQIGHPVLSINGSDLRHPGQTTIQSSSDPKPPIEDPTDTDGANSSGKLMI